MTNASGVAALGLNVRSAQIHVATRTTKGIFFVEGEMGNLPLLETRLRQLLQRSGMLSLFIGQQE